MVKTKTIRKPSIRNSRKKRGNKKKVSGGAANEQIKETKKEITIKKVKDSELNLANLKLSNSNSLNRDDEVFTFVSYFVETKEIKEQSREKVAQKVAQMEAAQKSMIGGGDIPEADKEIITGEKNIKILTRFESNIDNFKSEIKDSELDIDTSVNFVSDKGSVSFNLGEFKMLLDDETLILIEEDGENKLLNLFNLSEEDFEKIFQEESDNTPNVSNQNEYSMELNKKVREFKDNPDFYIFTKENLMELNRKVREFNEKNDNELINYIIGWYKLQHYTLEQFQVKKKQYEPDSRGEVNPSTAANLGRKGGGSGSGIGYLALEMLRDEQRRTRMRSHNVPTPLKFPPPIPSDGLEHSNHDSHYGLFLQEFIDKPLTELFKYLYNHLIHDEGGLNKGLINKILKPYKKSSFGDDNLKELREYFFAFLHLLNNLNPDPEHEYHYLQKKQADLREYFGDEAFDSLLNPKTFDSSIHLDQLFKESKNVQKAKELDLEFPLSLFYQGEFERPKDTDINKQTSSLITQFNRNSNNNNTPILSVLNKEKIEYKENHNVSDTNLEYLAQINKYLNDVETNKDSKENKKLMNYLKSRAKGDKKRVGIQFASTIISNSLVDNIKSDKSTEIIKNCFFFSYEGEKEVQFFYIKKKNDKDELENDKDELDFVIQTLSDKDKDTLLEKFKDSTSRQKVYNLNTFVFNVELKKKFIYQVHLIVNKYRALYNGIWATIKGVATGLTYGLGNFSGVSEGLSDFASSLGDLCPPPGSIFCAQGFSKLVILGTAVSVFIVKGLGFYYLKKMFEKELTLANYKKQFTVLYENIQKNEKHFNKIQIYDLEFLPNIRKTLQAILTLPKDKVFVRYSLFKEIHDHYSVYCEFTGDGCKYSDALKSEVSVGWVAAFKGGFEVIFKFLLAPAYIVLYSYNIVGIYYSIQNINYCNKRLKALKSLEN